MPGSSVLWGCFAAVVLSGVQSLGITLQRKSHVLPYPHQLSDDSVVSLRRENPPVEPDYARHTHTHRRNLWLVGFFLFITANIFGSLVQLTTLPLIILSPLQSIGLIFNSVLSCLLLPGEHFTWKLVSGTLVIAFGAFIVAFKGESTTAPPSDIGTDERFRIVMEKFLRPGFLGWWIFTFVFMALLLRINWGLSRKIKLLQLEPVKCPRKSLRHGADPVSRLTFITGILYGLISGTLTAHTFLFAKSIVDVFVESLMLRSSPKSLYTYFITVVLLALTLTIVGMQLVAFNLGLSNILTAILYPLCFLVYNLVNLINDLSFNSLLSRGYISVGDLLFIMFGLANVLLGVILISWDSAFAKADYSKDENRQLMAAKFPYEQLYKDGDRRVLSYEENEILSQFRFCYRD